MSAQCRTNSKYGRCHMHLGHRSEMGDLGHEIVLDETCVFRWNSVSMTYIGRHRAGRVSERTLTVKRTVLGVTVALCALLGLVAAPARAEVAATAATVPVGPAKVTSTAYDLTQNTCNRVVANNDDVCTASTQGPLVSYTSSYNSDSLTYAGTTSFLPVARAVDSVGDEVGELVNSNGQDQGPRGDGSQNIAVICYVQHGTNIEDKVVYSGARWNDTTSYRKIVMIGDYYLTWTAAQRTTYTKPC